MSMLLRALAVALTMAPLATACGATGDKKEGESAVAYSVADVRGPWSDRRVVLQAQEQHVAKCMKGKQQKYTPNSIPGQAPEWDEFGSFLPVGPGDDVTKAQREGFGSGAVIRRESDRPGDPNGAYARSLTPKLRDSWDKALLGDGKLIDFSVKGVGDGGAPANGCLAEAKKAIYSDLKTWVQAESTVNSLDGLIHQRFDADQQVTDTVRRWSECMAKSGYQYETPTKAYSEATSKARGAKRAGAGQAAAPPASEIRIAVASATCDKNVGLTHLEKSLWSKYQSQVLAQRESDVIAYRQLRSKALDRAKAILRDA